MMYPESRKGSRILIGMSDSWPDEITARIATEIKRLREDVLGVSGQWLSDRTADLGHRVSRSTISEIETKRRKSITVADLIILAAALDTVPLALIYPGPYDQNIRALPNLDVAQIWAARWFSGEQRTISEVPFDDQGHYIKLPHPQSYERNIRALEYAREAAKLYDQKAALWRELNQKRHNKMTGTADVSDDEIKTMVSAIATLQDQINYFLRPADWSQEVFEKLMDEMWPSAEESGPDGG